GRGQRVVIGVEDEDSKQLCRLALARVAADRMDSARRFGPALARPIDARLAVIHLRLDRARNHIGVDESRLRVGVGHGGRAGRVIDFHGEQRLARDVGNGRLEVLRDGLRFAIMGVDGVGHREGEGGAGGGDDGSDLHGLSPSAYRLVSFFIVSSRPCRPADYGHRTGRSRGMKSTWGPGSIMNTASVARTQATVATAIAMWNPKNSSGPPCCRTPPSRAMAKRDPARETALLTPDAVPARSDSTEVRTRVVNGAIARLMPSDTNRMGGKISAQ